MIRLALAQKVEFSTELCQHLLAVCPLARGFLSGKYHAGQTEAGSQRNVSRYFNERGWKVLAEVEAVGAELGGKSASQVSLAWLLANPTITSPIIGPRDLGQLQDNLGATSLQLSEDQVKRLSEASKEEY